ncbi:MAG: VOC family protein [Saccharofermentans sp.]|nr:VOC family protein [Saccharofermentans sp.]
MSSITGIHHVSMKTSTPDEYQKTVHFYSEVLELPIVRTWAKGIMFDTSNGIVEIFNDGEGSLSKGMIRHYAFAVSDVDSVVARVKEAGYEVFVEPKDIVIQSEVPYPARIAFCFGPLGEEIEFFMER